MGSAARAVRHPFATRIARLVAPLLARRRDGSQNDSQIER
jgi:hypothetical protein